MLGAPSAPRAVIPSYLVVTNTSPALDSHGRHDCKGVIANTKHHVSFSFAERGDCCARHSWRFMTCSPTVWLCHNINSGAGGTWHCFTNSILHIYPRLPTTSLLWYIIICFTPFSATMINPDERLWAGSGSLLPGGPYTWYIIDFD